MSLQKQLLQDYFTFGKRQASNNYGFISLKPLLGFLGFLGVTTAMVPLVSSYFSQSAKPPPIVDEQQVSQAVLAASAFTPSLQGNIVFNIPATFNEDVTLNKGLKTTGLTVTGDETVIGNLKVQGKTIDVGGGNVVASNVLYGVTAGSGITVGTGQNPTITNSGVTSFQGSTGSITLSAGSGISISGTTITNSDVGSAQNIFKNITVGSSTIAAGSNSDTLTFVAGTNISLSANTSTKQLTITSTGGGALSGLTTNGVLYATSATTATTVAPGTAGYVLSSNGAGSAPSWIPSGSTQYWQLNSGVLSPLAITNDLVVGGVATSSAKFQVSGTTGNIVASGTLTGLTGLNSSGSITFSGLSTGVVQATSGVLGISAVNLASQVTGILPLQFGGTGANLSSGGSTGSLTYYNGSTLAFTGAGSSNQCLLGGTTPAWGSCALGSNWWTSTNGALYPINSTLDVLFGGTSSSSANFAFLNNASGTPTASVSGNLTLNSAGVLATTNMQQLTLGSSTTGSIQLSPKGTTGLFVNGSGNVGIGTTTPLYQLDLSTGSGNGNISQLHIAAGDNLAANQSTGILFGMGSQNLGSITLNGNQGVQTFGSAYDLNIINKWTTNNNGKINLGTNNSVSMTIDHSGNVGIGTAGPSALLDIISTGQTQMHLGKSGQFTSYNLIVSTGGTDRFDWQRSHTINGTADVLALTYDGTNDQVGIGTVTTSSLLTLQSRSATSPIITGNYATAGSNSTINLYENGTGNMIFQTNASGAVQKFNTNGANTRMTIDQNGNVGIGAAASSFMLQVAGNVGPNATDTYNLGSSSLEWNNLYVKNLISTGNTAGFWQRNSGVLSPTNITDDLTIGGVATSSALFQVFGNTGNATTSGNFVFNGGSQANNLIAARNKQGLTIGDSQTGNIIFNGGNVGIGNNVNPSSLLTLQSVTALEDPIITGNSSIATSNSTINLYQNGTGNMIFTTNFSGAETQFNTAGVGINGVDANTELYISDAGSTTKVGETIVNTAASTSVLRLWPFTDGKVYIQTGTTNSSNSFTPIIFSSINNTSPFLAVVPSSASVASVGIGTSSPTGSFEVQAASGANHDPLAKFDSSGATDGNSIFLANGSGTFSFFIAGGGSQFMPNTAAGDGGIRVNASQKLFFGDSSTTRMVIDSSSHVGIGTTTINAALDLGTTQATNKIYLIDGSNDKYGFGANTVGGNGALQIYAGAASSTSFIQFGKYDGTTMTEFMRLNNGGNLGLGNASPVGRLDVAGAIVGKALAILNETGDQAIFTASASGAPEFTILHSGALVAPHYNTQGGLMYLADTAGTLAETAQGTAAQCLLGGSIPAWGACALGSNWWTSTNGALYPINSTLDVLFGGTATSSAKVSFTNMATGNPTMALGLAGTSNGVIDLNSSGAGKTAPSLAADSSGNLNITASSGIVNVGNGTGDITLDPGGSNLVANLSGVGSFLVEAAGATFVTFDKNSATTFAYPGTTTTAITVNGSSLTTGTDLALNGASAMTTASLLSLASDTYIHTVAAETGKVINLAFTDNSTFNSAGTTQTIGLNVAPTFGATGASGTHELYGAYFQTPTINTPTGTNNLYGIRIGNYGGSGVTNAYGLYVNTQSGATNNYAAVFAGGNVGVGTTTPAYGLDVNQLTAAFNSGQNGTLGTWTTNTNTLPATMRNMGVVASNGYIYSIGGNNGSASSNVYYAKLNASGSVDSWVSTTALPGARYTGGSFAANGYIYQLGGFDASAARAEVYFAKQNNDGSLGSWTATTSLPAARYAFELTMANGYVYVLGGVNGSSTVVNTIWYAKLNPDGSVGPWNTTTTTPNAGGTGVAYGIASTANGFVYLVGGYNGSATEANAYYFKINSDGTLAAALTTTSLPASESKLSGYEANGYVYILGGTTDNANTGAVSTVYYARLNSDGTLGSWTTNTNALPAAVFLAQTAAANGYVYVLGGANSSNSLVSTTYYSSTARVSLAANLDLLGLTSQSLASSSGLMAGLGAAGGSIYAGNIFSNGALQVTGNATFNNSLGLAGNLSVNGSSYISGANIGEALAIFNETGDQNILTASASGTTKFSIDRSGDLISANAAKWMPLSDSTSALQIANAGGTSFISFDSTNNRVGIGTTATAPHTGLEVGSTGTIGTYDYEMLMNPPSGFGARFAFTSNSGSKAVLMGETSAGNGDFSIKTTANAVWGSGTATWTNRFTVTNGGNVGIGTNITSPAFGIDLQDSVSSTVAAMFTNLDTGASGAVLGLKTMATTAGTGNNFLTFLDGKGEIIGKVNGNGSGGVSYATTGIDFAEYYKKDITAEDLQPGTVVCQGVNGVTTCVNSQHIVGVVSNRAGFVGGSEHAGDSNYVLVGLVGQLPVKIATNSGILSGDHLMVTGTGIATKATSAGETLGIALQDQSAQASDGTIMVSINASWFDPGTALATNNGLLSASQSASIENNLSNVPLLTADTATVSGTLNVLGRTTLSDVGITGTLSDGVISIHGLQGQIDTLAGDLMIQSEGLGGVNFLNGLVTIDTSGNVSTKAVLSAQTVTAEQLNIKGNKSAGSAVIPAGQTAITINAAAMQPASKVFLTLTSITTKQLIISQKANGQFTVAITSADASDISFDWLIVGNQ